MEIQRALLFVHILPPDEQNDTLPQGRLKRLHPDIGGGIF